MSVELTVTIIAVVLIMATLVAWVAWLAMRGTRSNVQQSPAVSCSPTRTPLVVTHTCNHECAPHNHDWQYASINHNHDERYALAHHTHDYARRDHTHPDYVTMNTLNVRIGQLERRIANQRAMLMQSPLGILLGLLFGGLIGALVGMILDVTLPRSVFEIHGTARFLVGGQTITEQFTAHSAWPKWGIVLGCTVAGMILGGLTLWIVGLVRNRRQSTVKGA